jgi:hypothetical protein
MHWKSLTVEQCKKVLESHIFFERKQDGVLKAGQVAGGNKHVVGSSARAKDTAQ